MPQNESKRVPVTEPREEPWGELLAKVKLGQDSYTWVRLCMVYRCTDGCRGQLKFEMITEPLAWSDKTIPREMMIVKLKKEGRA